MRRVRAQNKLDELFPVWRHQPFFSPSIESTVMADLTHRGHAIIDTVFSDLIDGSRAHMPSGRFAPNSVWAIFAMITHDLLRAVGNAESRPTRRRARRHAATPDRQRPSPARPPTNADKCCTCPRTGPWADRWLGIWNGFGHARTASNCLIHIHPRYDRRSIVDELGRPARRSRPDVYHWANTPKQPA